MQYKSLINPSYLVLMLDFQEHLKNGWEIDPDNLPVQNMMYHEVHLIKDDEDGVFVSNVDDDKYVLTKTSIVEKPKAKAGRPAQQKS